MSKAFKKGDLVTYISDWDRKGTVCYRNAVVYSCGVKQMVLTDEATGAELGRNFKPVVGRLENVFEDVKGVSFVRRAGGAFPRMTDEEAVAAGLKVAAAIQQLEREHYARCLAGNHGEAYDAAIRKDLAALHDLKVIKK